MAAPSRLQKATDEVQKYIDQFMGEPEQEINSGFVYSTFKAIVYRTQVVAAGINYIVTLEDNDGSFIIMLICVNSKKKVSMIGVKSTAAPKDTMGAPTGLMKATGEVQKYIDQFKKEAEKKVNNGKAYSTFKAIMYRSQLVDGNNYFVTVEVGDGHYIKMSLYKEFNGEPSLTSVEID